jgi:hypothetical protein
VKECPVTFQHELPGSLARWLRLRVKSGSRH